MDEAGLPIPNAPVAPEARLPSTPTCRQPSSRAATCTQAWRWPQWALRPRKAGPSGLCSLLPSQRRAWKAEPQLRTCFPLRALPSCAPLGSRSLAALPPLRLVRATVAEKLRCSCTAGASVLDTQHALPILGSLPRHLE